MSLHFSKWFQWSRGKHEKPCPDREECLKTLQMFLDGELKDEAMRNKIEHKLLECNDCIENFKLEQSIREVIKTKLACKNCPEELAQSIRIKIKEDV